MVALKLREVHQFVQGHTVVGGKLALEPENDFLLISCTILLSFPTWSLHCSPGVMPREHCQLPAPKVVKC